MLKHFIHFAKFSLSSLPSGSVLTLAALHWPGLGQNLQSTAAEDYINQPQQCRDQIKTVPTQFADFNLLRL